MSIASSIQAFHANLPTGVRLVAVSKFQPVERLEEAYQAGQRIFGENRALEMRDKHERMPADVEWHFLGHLQQNKIKYIAPFVSLIHSVDSAELLQAIDRQAEKCGRVIDCLLQVHIAMEETKFGFSPEEALSYLAGGTWKDLSHVRICGMMGMATYTDDQAQVRREFEALADCFQQAKVAHFRHEASFRELSMGMSGDYPIALEAGSTLVRIGTSIFGSRPTR